MLFGFLRLFYQILPLPAVFFFFSVCIPYLLGAQSLPMIELPEQAPPPLLQKSLTPIKASDLGPNTNLVILLDQIRTLTQDGRLVEAQKIASAALANISEIEQNEFYLRQIKSEETKLYFKLANSSMLQKEYSQASKYIEKYRANVAEELASRKLRREIKTELSQNRTAQE